MEEIRRLQSATDNGSQAKIDEARRLEEEDREEGNPMVRGWFPARVLG